MAKIGIVPISGKPYHAGHDGLVRLAAKECDEVRLYVSTSDREEVSGQAMKTIWERIISPTLPENVVVELGGSPVGKAFKYIGDADVAGLKDELWLYSDVKDAAANFPAAYLQKYAPNAFNEGRIHIRPVERTSTVNVSGTQMRRYLKDGDKQSFLRFMPPAIDGEEVWRILTSTAVEKPKPRKASRAKNEALLRCYVRSVLSQKRLF